MLVHIANMGIRRLEVVLQGTVLTNSELIDVQELYSGYIFNNKKNIFF